MVQNLALVSHGEPNWDVKVNAAIKALNEVGGVASSLQWTEKSSEGLVFQNGFQNTGTNYQYIKIGNYKIVSLQLAVTLPSDLGSTKSAIACVLPDLIKPNDTYSEFMENEKYQLTLSEAGVMIGLASSAAGWWFGSGSHYLLNKLYLAK